MCRYHVLLLLSISLITDYDLIIVMELWSYAGWRTLPWALLGSSLGFARDKGGVMVPFCLLPVIDTISTATDSSQGSVSSLKLYSIFLVQVQSESPSSVLGRSCQSDPCMKGMSSILF